MKESGMDEKRRKVEEPLNSLEAFLPEIEFEKSSLHLGRQDGATGWPLPDRRFSLLYTVFLSVFYFAGILFCAFLCFFVKFFFIEV